MARPRKKKTVKPTPKPCLGFRFTEEEEMLIDMHIVNSIRFMRKYGKGTQPFYRR